MSFDIGQFFKTNQTTFIWLCFSALVYSVWSSGLFGLVFITFLLCFLTNKILRKIKAHSLLQRRIWTTVVYIVLITILLAVGSFILPKLGSEARAFVSQLPSSLTKLTAYLDELAVNYPQLRHPVSVSKEYLSLENLGISREALVNIVVTSLDQVTKYTSYVLLGLLFSYLIMLDYPNLRTKVTSMRNTRVRPIYDQVADVLYNFALVVGEAFKAQFLISCFNTVFTTVGLWVLDIQPIALLSTIVFLAGLIPVLGTFISTTPILLLAFNAGGLQLSFAATVMIVGVHLLETYVLNPRIFSAIFKISPLFTLVILFLGHKLMGVVGLLLSVPVAVFLYRQLVLGAGNPAEVLQPGEGASDAASPDTSDATSGSAKGNSTKAA